MGMGPHVVVMSVDVYSARDVYSELDENLFLSLDARGDGEPLTVLLAQASRVVEEPPAPTRSVAMRPGPGPGCVGSRAEGRWPAVAAQGKAPVGTPGVRLFPGVCKSVRLVQA